MNVRYRAWLGSLLAVAVLLVVGCSDSNTNPIGPSNEPEIGNNPDSFQFQASNLSHTTQTLTYSWTNTGTTANIDQSGRVENGEATLVLRDSAGNQVYSRTLTNTGTFASSSGTAGIWRIEVRLRDVSGTLNFRVQRRE